LRAKFMFMLVVLAACGLAGQAAAAEPAALPELSVAVWRNDADAAISLSFDDGTADHWQRGMALWDEFGFKVTLGIISSTFAPERIPQLAQAHRAGHELANHCATHPDLLTLTPEDQRAEFKACNDFLLSNVPDLDYVTTAIYPYEHYDDTTLGVLEDMGFLFARSGYQGVVDYAELNDPWNPPLLHLYSWANLNTLPVTMWNDTTDWALEHGGWLVEQCHGIGAEGEPGVGWNPRPAAEYREHYQYIASLGDRVWVAPIREVGTYLIERNYARIKVTESTGGHLEFEVATGLDLPIPLLPVTMRMQQLEGWDAIYVRQHGKPLAVTEYTKDGAPYLRFEVMPDSGVVSITRH
jgi:peptidoglycan/xylan/chitin deacetylase (PgdA/CDA1 family)